MAGRWLALSELGHWYEAAVVLALIVLAAGRLPIVALILLVATYGAVVVADNSLPRATWRMALAVAWGIGGAAAIVALMTAGAVGVGIGS
jgi:hypothetical protein